jgi:hypothetical protein
MNNRRDWVKISPIQKKAENIRADILQRCINKAKTNREVNLNKIRNRNTPFGYNDLVAEILKEVNIYLLYFLIC